MPFLLWTFAVLTAIASLDAHCELGGGREKGVETFRSTLQIRKLRLRLAVPR